MINRELIIFDFETNGFNGTSVLSLSAIKVAVKDEGLEEVDRYNRFYFRTPGEIENPSALKINNLYCENIKKYRENADYPEHYVDDVPSFVEFCGDADHFVAHNFSFDRDFVGFETLISFCTFLEAKNIDIGKYNKLSDLARYYGIEVLEENLHNSMYDVELLFEILKKMYEEKNENLLKFIGEKPLNKKEQKYIQVRFNSYLRSKKDTREHYLRKQSQKPSSKIIKNIVEKLKLPNYDITVSQFLKAANPVLLENGISELTAIDFNKYLKFHGILEDKNRRTCIGKNAEEYGIYTKLKENMQGNSIETICYNSTGKGTLKEYLEKYLIEICC